MSYRPKTVLTTVGPVTAQRAYYHCQACSTGHIPYDHQSGLGRGQLSSKLASLVSLLAMEAVYWDDPIEGRQLRYVGRLEGCESFGERLWYVACECGLREAQEVVVLGDGAPWIWNQARIHFSRAQQILDWYHAAEHVWSCANGLYDEGSAAAGCWAQRMLRVLHDQGGSKLLFCLLQSQRARKRPAEALSELIGYVTANVERMDYPSYRSQGLDIGSGPVESACKRLVGARLKGPGMRWTAPGADAILALRIVWFNGQWQELWKSKPLAA